MLANYEFRKYEDDGRIWIGKYKNLQNLPHWHYDCELITVERGSALISVDSKTFHLTKGQSVFINSQKIHYIQADKDSILSFFLYDYKLTEKITNNVSLVSPLLNNKYDIKEIYNFIENELKNKLAFYSFITEQKLKLLVATIFRKEPTTHVNDHKERYNDLYKTLLAEIDKNLQYYTFKDAAAFMSFSEPYFSNYFYKMSGMTFSQYLNYAKTERAINLLKSDRQMSITEIALECGFGTIRNFNRVFKKITGYTPKNLPKDYNLLNLQPIDSKNNFDPTLNESELL